MEYAPVLITVYNRHLHLKRCVDSLLRCPESKDTVLYIASDAPARKEDEEDVLQVREYIERIKGFSKVIALNRKKNIGAFNNSHQARRTISDVHPTHIRLEDDVVVGKGFLFFMNAGLEEFKDDPKVVAVCGYLPPNIKSKNGQPFAMSQFTPYGFAKWSDKDKSIYKMLDTSVLKELFNDFSFFREFEKNHPISARSLPLLWNGDFIPGDIFHDIVMQKNNYLALYPPESITATRGNDGTGVNAGISRVLQSQEPSDLFFNTTDLNIENGLNVRRKISSSRRKFFSRFLNYSIYFSSNYVKGYYYIYRYARWLTKYIRRIS